MNSDDLTVRVLIQIRDKLDETNGRIDQTNKRLDETIDRLEGVQAKVVASEIHLSTQLTAMHGTLRDVANASTSANRKSRGFKRRSADFLAELETEPERDDETT